MSLLWCKKTRRQLGPEEILGTPEGALILLNGHPPLACLRGRINVDRSQRSAPLYIYAFRSRLGIVGLRLGVARRGRSLNVFGQGQVHVHYCTITR